jgi:hypothetical protein
MLVRAMIRNLFTASFFLGLLLWACRSDNGSARPSQGAAAPNITWTSISGDAGTSLEGLRGRPVLLEFWRTW